MRFHQTFSFLGLLLCVVLDSTDGLQTAVRPDKGSAVTVSTDRDQCSVCTASGVNDTDTPCHQSLPLTPEEEVKLLFKCSEPIERAFTVTIKQTIVCTKNSCSPAAGEAQQLLTDLTRTFVWELTVPERTVVRLDIQGNGLSQSSGPCADGVQYSVSKSRTDPVEQYCRGGPVSFLDVKNQAAVSLKFNPKSTVESAVFLAAPLKGRTMDVTVDGGTQVVLSRKPSDPECDVCSKDECSPTEKTLSSVEKVPLRFGCTNPQDIYSVKITKQIGCTKTSCSPNTAEVDPTLFKGFKRMFTWNITLPQNTVLTLDFPGQGLEETFESESCKDGFRYVTTSRRSDGNTKQSSYCRGGSVSTLNLPGDTEVVLEVPREEAVPQTLFEAKAVQRGSRMIDVTTDSRTKVTISRDPRGPDCNVCVFKDSVKTCAPKQVLKGNMSVEFTCARPQDVFTVEVNRDIDCAKMSCSGDIIQGEYSLFPDFNRTFIWDLKVVSTTAFQLDFPEPGMRQIPNKEICLDEHTYSVITYLRTGPATIGTFCKGGPVSTLLVRYKGRMFLQVPGDKKLDPVDFKFSTGPQTDRAAIVKVKLPRGVSDTSFITPNYPKDFPDNEDMQWDFNVPGMHNYSITFTDHTAPECLSKDVVVEYNKEDNKMTKLSLTDPQPKHQQGNFQMVLRNCVTNKTLQGLTLNFKVSVMRSGHPVLCTVDLTTQQAVSVQIEKVGSDPYCEMSINSKLEKKLNVPAGSKATLSFLDCPNEDVRLTATEQIGCRDPSSCPVTLLTVPKLDSCFPMPLHSVTWQMNIPEDSTVDLVSPTGSLQQSLPKQECSNPVLLHVAESDGVSVGDFCFNGAIQKIQAHTNVSVTVTAPDFRKTQGPFLNVSFSPDFSETVIYTVNPSDNSPTLLASPSWPRGMKPSSTVSWIVNLPQQFEAVLEFVNVSQPKCEDRHTSIIVKMVGYADELMSRREDETPKDKLLVPHSFYLNLSNCDPVEGEFGTITRITLQKKSNLLAIVLGIVGAVLLLLVVLLVVCVVIKKKKAQKMNAESSMYVPKGNIFRPNDRSFTKPRSDNDSHVYTSIDEMMVYSHLLGDSTYSDSMSDHYKGVQVDSYQTFTGPTDGGLPVIKEPDPEPELDQYRGFLAPSETFIPSRPRTPIDRQDSIGFQDRRMVDNELYTFKSTGDINTIRLSRVDLEPEPYYEPVSDESL